MFEILWDSMQSSIKSYFLRFWFVFLAGPPFTIPRLFFSYRAQQLDEIVKMLQLVEGHKNPILMGVFNNGPTTSQLISKYPLHHGLIAARGFVNPYYILDGRCTFCANNSIAAGFGSVENSLEYHIWITAEIFRKVKHVKVVHFL